MNWRPPDWKYNYKGQSLFLAREDSNSLRSGLMERADTVFEAGADAMLKVFSELPVVTFPGIPDAWVGRLRLLPNEEK